MPDETAVWTRECCETPPEAIHPWWCPATPLWADLVTATRMDNVLDAVLHSMAMLPLNVINRIDIGLWIDPATANWKLTQR